MKEIYKDIRGYKGIYQVSNYGKVKSLSRKKKNNSNSYIMPERILCPRFNNFGYLRVILTNKKGEKKNYSVHRLVAELFISNPNNKPEVNHIDGNKINNYLGNLEWVTRIENIEHYSTLETQVRKPRKVSPEIVKEIYNRYWIPRTTIKQLAKEYNTNTGTIYKIIHNRYF